MRHNPYRYGDDIWNIGDRVLNFAVKRPQIAGTVTNIVPAPNGSGRDFLVCVSWDNEKGYSSHLNGLRLTRT